MMVISFGCGQTVTSSWASPERELAGRLDLAASSSSALARTAPMASSPATNRRGGSSGRRARRARPRACRGPLSCLPLLRLPAGAPGRRGALGVVPARRISGQLVEASTRSSVRKKARLHDGGADACRGSRSKWSVSIQPSQTELRGGSRRSRTPPRRRPPASRNRHDRARSRCARITGSTARVTFIGPKRFVSTWERNCPGDHLLEVPRRPKFACVVDPARRSGPKRSTAASTQACAAAGSVMSQRHDEEVARERPTASLDRPGVARWWRRLGWPASSARRAICTRGRAGPGDGWNTLLMIVPSTAPVARGGGSGVLALGERSP
jgi:hypothetical protein